MLNKVFIVIFLCANSLYGSFVIRDDFVKVFDVSLGSNVAGSLSLYNPSDVAVSVNVTQADYAYTQVGDDYFIEPGKYERSNARWISFQNTILLPPKENIIYSYTINVPKDRTLMGSYWSVLFFEEIMSTPTSNIDELNLDFRYCIQIISSIKNTGTIDLSYANVAFYDNSIVLSLRNSGNLWIDASIKIDIFDDDAKLINSHTTENHRVYPELDKKFKIPIPALKPANYYAIIVVDCGDNKVFGHQLSFRN